MPKTERDDPLGFLNTQSLVKHQKIEGENFYFRKKISPCQKRLKGGTLWDFTTSILTQNSKKFKGTLWGKKFPKKKSRSAKKN